MHQDQSRQNRGAQQENAVLVDHRKIRPQKSNQEH